MEIKHRVLVLNNNPQYDKLKKAFDALSIKYEVKQHGLGVSSIICFLSDNDPNYEKLKPLIYKEHVIVQTGVYYSKKDIDDAEWFYINTSESQYPEGEDDYHNETYELTNWCNKCGIGAIQNRPFRLSRDFQQKRDQFFGLHWVFDELFARSEMKTFLEENDISGISYLNPVFHKSGKVIQTTIQLQINSIIQPGLVFDGLDKDAFAADRNLWTDQAKYAMYCPFCKRVKYRYPKTDIITFKRASFQNTPDIVKSYEYFGGGAQAQRLILVSKKFYQAVTEHKLRGLIFTPIKLVK